MKDRETLEGGCQCGAVRYTVAGPPLETYVCHCTECRRQSSSAFGISVIVSANALRVTRGEPRTWSRPTDSGGALDCSFCPRCGSRLWHRGRSDPERVSIKGGSLDRPVDLSTVAHIWTSRRLPGVLIPESSPRFAQEPVEDEPAGR